MEDKEYKVLSFQKNYKDMNDPTKDYSEVKLLMEFVEIQNCFICVKWGKTTKNGTKGTFNHIKEADAMIKLNELMCSMDKMLNKDKEEIK